MTTVVRRRPHVRAALVVGAVVLACAACDDAGHSWAGASNAPTPGDAPSSAAAQPSMASRAPSPESTPTATGASPADSPDPCALLTGADLRLRGSDAIPRPDRLDGWDRVCKWSSMQFNAGYTPPPEAKRGDFPPGPAGDLRMATQGADRLAEVMRNSSAVIVRIAFRSGAPNPLPSSYTTSGRRVEVNPPDASAPDTCGVSTSWRGGTVTLAVSDGTHASEEPCARAKRLMAVVTAKIPS
ncbi:DUF3558 family protein [Embleya hyalina]|uniref:DUF3558 domain-containing protein n=1 Tax=Embleya hyalina TaxID=516124 RepID=A0A401YQQ5_9ACTN|nr:DUF3558 family protein [Embleya hyalina]GCD96885.1 hypothetical protein EHYA_04572 [Embleya hyalina]